MITVIVFVILFLIALGLFVVGKVETHDYNGKVRATYHLRKWTLIPAGLGLLTLIFGSIYTQDPGEAIVIRSFSGKVIGSDVSEGLGFTAPWNSTISFDIRNQRLEMFTNNDGTEGEDGSVIVAPLEGSSNAYVSITIRYSIKASCVSSVYAKHKNQESLEDNVLKPSIRDIVRNETANFKPLEVKERRAELAVSVQDSLNKRWADDCAVVDNVDLGALSLDPATEKAIQARNKATIAVDTARSKLDQANINAERTKVLAKADADSDQIIRCGAVVTEVTKVIAGKETTATELTPKEGVACEERLNAQVLYAKYLEAIAEIGKNGNMVVVVPEGADAPDLILPANK